jgi:L-fuconolactonase
METSAEYFGIDTICFGSDWPVCLLAGSFKQVHDVVARFSEQLNDTEKEKIFGANTAAFYKI